MKTYFIFLVLCVMSTKIAFSQTIQLEKTSLGSGLLRPLAGTPGIKVSAIIGQPSPVNHFQNDNFHILQGFKTPYLSARGTSKSKNVSVYPNPSFGEIIIEWIGESTDEMLTIELIEMSGKGVDKRAVKLNDLKVNVDFSDVACGIYILRISGEKNGTSNTKLFIK
jgi:hypothetical protein